MQSFPPRTCARGTIYNYVIVQHENDQIWRSSYIKGSERLINITKVSKLALLCFELFGKVHKRHKYWIFLLATPIEALSAYLVICYYPVCAHAIRNYQALIYKG
jgi:hypothetical protein